MSEQTPDTNSNMADGQDPSMEDILASIRKIIAEDDVQETTDIVEINDDALEVEATTGDVAGLAHVDTLDLDILTDEVTAIDADIDALLGDMDVDSSDALEIPQIETVAMSDDVMDDVLDLEIPMDEPEVDEFEVDELETEALAMDDTLDLAVDEPLASGDSPEFEDELDNLIAEMDDEIISRAKPVKPARGLMGGAMAALGLGGAAIAAKASPSDAVEPPEDDLSLMLDNMLEDSASYQETEAATDERIGDDRVIDPAEDLLAELDLGEDDAEVVTSSDTDPDMDLVKSLMADLTEEPLHDEPEIDAVEARSTDIDDDEDASTDDVMDEILSMTLDDEAKLSEEIAIPEIPAPEVKPANLSLKEIAAQADADAQSSESMLGKGMVAAAGLGVIGAAAVAAATQEDEDSADESESDDIDAALSQLDDLLAEDQLADKMTELDDLDTHTPEPHTQEQPIEETPKMARANKSDAIIDEVTETATAGAFASLSSVVEEKATVAERGDRIGDLVMEALQPMLKEWLDANLKGIVERAVAKEVKRISSGK